ncbi:S33 family peptidase [Streptococcus varani]|uniref:S33 family peptidase n=1 Tax=Streptococcus varani TaxID=1608583 RepID=A0A0E4H6C7_9STRE|nr:alpha/beta fold hydrolase [Streptococcus varani]CQR25719.1 S33 family peptidase [Streptococcus varani]
MELLSVKEYGQTNTQTILFLHATGSSSHMWQHHIRALQSDFHCITVDLPGHGDSYGLEWTSFDDVADLLVQIIKSKVHGKPHLVGLSLGASLILKLLEKHSQLIDRVIVDGASHQPIKGYRKIIIGVYLASLFKNSKMVTNMMVKMMKADGGPQEDYELFIRDMKGTTRKSFRRAMSQAIRLRIEGSFDNPVFFVSGQKESEEIHQSHRFLVQKNSFSEFGVYPKKGHAWLFSDVQTHIQLVRYFFQGATFPERLQRLM